MSHFCVLVIGENVEAQLAPFDEGLEFEPYIDEGMDVAKGLVSALEWLRDDSHDHSDFPTGNALLARFQGRQIPELTIEERLELLRWYHGNEEGQDAGWRIEDGQLVYYTTHNADAKWDWYEIGGRWNGRYQLKPGAPGRPVELHYSELKDPPDYTGRSDQARKGDIDFEAMRAEATQRAAVDFDTAMSHVVGIQPPTRGWKDQEEGLSNRYPPRSDELDAAREVLREAYNAHPWIAALRKAGLANWRDPFETFFVTAPDPRQAYIDARVLNLFGTYAIVHNGEWVAQGEMGWFGMSNNTVSTEEFHRREWELIQSLPDDTLMTIVDCHT